MQCNDTVKKMQTKELKILNHGALAGWLTKTGRGTYSFVYDDNYIKSELPPISVNLPKRKEPFHSKGMFPYFSSILPEGYNRNLLCKYYKIDEMDDFSLLELYSGKDFIGSIGVEKE